MNEEKIKQDNKVINRILLVSALIILVASIEALITGKSREVFEAFRQVNPQATGDEFLSYVLMRLLMNILEPILISLYVFFTYRKWGVPPVFKFIFGGMIVIRIVNLVIQFNLGSIFYYLLIILNIIFFVVIIKTPTRRKVKNGLF